MADEEAIWRKHELLAAEMRRYFLETCPALTARWKTAIVGLAPPVLRELARRLQALEAVTNETDRELKASHLRRRGPTVSRASPGSRARINRASHRGR
jgi:hypothetical protein